MITGIKTTPLGGEVLKAYLRGEPHKVKVASRDITFMATCHRATFTEWSRIARELPKAEPRQLNAVAMKLEKLGLVQCQRPVVAEPVGHRTRFAFDKDGNHKWV